MDSLDAPPVPEDFPPAHLRHMVEQYVLPTPAEYAQLWGKIEERRVGPGTLLCEAGQVCEYVFFVVAGTARHYSGGAVREGTSWFSFAGDVMTDVDSFFSRQPSLFNIAAATALHAYGISRAHLDELYATSHTWERCGRLITEAYLVVMARSAFLLRFQTARERYEELLQRQPDIELYVPLGQIASYLGIAQETLSRLRSQ